MRQLKSAVDDKGEYLYQILEYNTLYDDIVTRIGGVTKKDARKIVRYCDDHPELGYSKYIKGTLDRKGLLNIKASME